MDVRHLNAPECQAWARRALKEGTGFIAPNVKTVRTGMSGSNFNKCLDALRGILQIATERGMLEENHAWKVERIPTETQKVRPAERKPVQRGRETHGHVRKPMVGGCG